MAFLPDLPPTKTPVDAKLIEYLQQMLADPGNASANPKKLRHLVAFFEDEPGRLFVMPGQKYTDMGWVGGPSDNVPAQLIKRADTALSVIFEQDVGGVTKTMGWMYLAGSHGRSELE